MIGGMYTFGSFSGVFFDANEEINSESVMSGDVGVDR